jgi:iron(III) transport system substrate-binding protein
VNVRGRLRTGALALAALLAAGTLAACGGGGGDAGEEPLPEDALVVYSGRAEDLVAPVIESFEQETGIDVAVRYGTTAEMAAQLLEEGDGSPADLYFSQDAGALQAVEDAALLAPLSQSSLDLVDPVYRSDADQWVGISGRARVLTYNTDLVAQDELPASVLELTGPRWKDQVAWAPTNASFQSFVTALRLTLGEEAAEKWLTDMVANGAKSYESNVEIRDAVDAGTVQVGLSNHYYLYEKIAEVGADGVTAANHYFEPGDVGSLVNVAGVGILASSDKQSDAQKLVDYLLSEAGQTYFAESTFEYPLVAGVAIADALRPLDEVAGPDISLGQLADVAATQELLTKVGLI